MTLQQIIYFVEVAKTQHFTKAAANLYISQSSLSHSIQVLEQELEVPLFVRKSGKKVALTDYAEKFLVYCQRILADVNDARDAISRMKNPLSGIVKVTYSYINCSSLVPRLFNQFYHDNDYQDVKVEFNINHGQQKLEEELVQGKYDLCFSCTPQMEGLESVPIAEQELFVLMPTNHPLAGEQSLTVEMLKNEKFICFYHGWNLANWVEKMFQQYNLTPDYAEYVTSSSEQAALISLGVGIAITPKFPVDETLLTYVPLDDGMRFRNIYLAWAKNRKASPAVEYVKNYCLSYFDKQ